MNCVWRCKFIGYGCCIERESLFWYEIVCWYFVNKVFLLVLEWKFLICCVFCFYYVIFGGVCWVVLDGGKKWCKVNLFVLLWFKYFIGGVIVV